MSFSFVVLTLYIQGRKRETRTAENIQEVLKDLLGGTVKEMMEKWVTATKNPLSPTTPATAINPSA